MARALTKKNRETFILKADQGKPVEEQTGFLLGPVSYQVQQDVMQMVLTGGTGVPLWVTKLLKACLKGTEEGRPLRDEDGEAVPFEVDKHGLVKDRWLELLSFPDRVEIAENRLATFMPELEKDEELSDVEKSEPSSPSA